MHLLSCHYKTHSSLSKNNEIIVQVQIKTIHLFRKQGSVDMPADS
jgi:hypothetical protein